MKREIALPKKLHIVVLNEAGVEALAKGIIGNHLFGRWIIAKTIEQSAFLSVGALELNNGLHDNHVEIHIPYQFVLYVASSDRTQILGFENDHTTSDTRQ